MGTTEENEMGPIGKQDAEISTDYKANQDEPDGRSTITVDAPPRRGTRRRRRFVIIGGSALLIAILAGFSYWLYARQYESTDDAFIDGDIVQISPKIPAYVKKVLVKSNQFVHKGDLLVELDPTDYEAKLEQAKAQLQAAQSQRDVAKATLDLTSKTSVASRTQAESNLETAKTNVEQTRLAADSKRALIDQSEAAARTAAANLGQVQAQVPQAESNLKLAEDEYKRRLSLFDRGDISQQALDQASNNLQVARSQVNSMEKQVLAARSRVDEANAAVATAKENYRQSLAQIELTRSQVNESNGRLEDAAAAPERVDVSSSQVDAAEAQIAAAETAVHQAELELSYTKIVAPEDGYVTKKNVEEGQLVQTGTPLMAISQSDEIWVVANFKETQLENMKVGQGVDIEVDAFPSKTFHGKVESFQAGTGSRFSMLPAENASGNYVKVVQRVPVKIVFDEQPDKILLAPGMSVVPTVKVR